MDPELIAYLDRRFEEIDQKFDETHRLIGDNRRSIEENSSRISHSQLIVEGLRSDIQTVAEGVVSLNEKMDRKLEAIGTTHQQDRDLDRSAHRTLRRRVDHLEGRMNRIQPT